MFAPAVFGTSGPAADSDQLVGALALSIAVISTAEVIRTMRFLNVVLGTWVMLSHGILAGGSSPAFWNAVVIGAVLVVGSLPRGRMREQYGAWSARIR